MFVRTLSAFAFATLLCTPVGAAEDHPVVKQMKEKLKHPDKPFTMLVTLQIKVGKEKAFEDAFLEAQKGTKREKGCIAYEINRDTDHPEVYVLVEKWKNVDGLVDHLAQDHTTKLLKLFGDMVEKSSINVYTVPGE